MTDGHDIMNIFALALKKAVSNKSISGETLEDDFIKGYRYDDFKQTNLYKELKKWEESFFEYKLLQE